MQDNWSRSKWMTELNFVWSKGGPKGLHQNRRYLQATRCGNIIIVDFFHQGARETKKRHWLCLSQHQGVLNNQTFGERWKQSRSLPWTRKFKRDASSVHGKAGSDKGKAIKSSIGHSQEAWSAHMKSLKVLRIAAAKPDIISSNRWPNKSWWVQSPFWAC